MFQHRLKHRCLEMVAVFRTTFQIHFLRLFLLVCFALCFAEICMEVCSGGSSLSVGLPSNRRTISQYSNPCWPRSRTPYGVTRPQGVFIPCEVFVMIYWFEKSPVWLGGPIDVNYINRLFSATKISYMINVPLLGFLCRSNFLGGWRLAFYGNGKYDFFIIDIGNPELS